MGILQWACAHGDALPVTLDCAPTVELAPDDDSVDSNIVLIKGDGPIHWFGRGPLVTKRVFFPPGVNLIHHPQKMNLLSDRDRLITCLSVGTYSCDGQGNWVEVSFLETGERETARRLEMIEQRLARLEER